MEIKSLSLGSGRLQRRQVEALRKAVNVDRLRRNEQAAAEANISPIGRLLDSISSLPAIRQEKVDDLRSQIKDGSYDCDDRLERTIDRVLDDLFC